LIDKANYAQRERLAFIDFCLEYFGQVTRADLSQHFQTGSASCSRDLTLYRELAPQNLSLTHTDKTYHRTEQFKPLFGHDPQAVLESLSRGFGDGIANQPSFSELCFDAVRLIHPKPEVIAKIMRAIKNCQSLICAYQSISSGFSERSIVPHAIVNNGHRWHVRAFDRLTESFRDFVCTRFENLEIGNSEIKGNETRKSDHDWNSLLQLIVIAHPQLKHQKPIEMDYGMENGKLVLEVRAATAGYLLRQWGVDCSIDYRGGGEYQLALKNVDEFANWLPLHSNLNLAFH
jgi:predicted DNA-binding transcriptional regulator YafY